MRTCGWWRGTSSGSTPVIDAVDPRFQRGIFLFEPGVLLLEFVETPNDRVLITGGHGRCGETWKPSEYDRTADQTNPVHDSPLVESEFKLTLIEGVMANKESNSRARPCIAVQVCILSHTSHICAVARNHRYREFKIAAKTNFLKKISAKMQRRQRRAVWVVRKCIRVRGSTRRLPQLCRARPAPQRVAQSARETENRTRNRVQSRGRMQPMRDRRRARRMPSFRFPHRGAAPSDAMGQ